MEGALHEEWKGELIDGEGASMHLSVRGELSTARKMCWMETMLSKGERRIIFLELGLLYSKLIPTYCFTIPSTVKAKLHHTHIRKGDAHQFLWCALFLSKYKTKLTLH
jgi:hypothetical protein